MCEQISTEYSMLDIMRSCDNNVISTILVHCNTRLTTTRLQIEPLELSSFTSCNIINLIRQVSY